MKRWVCVMMMLAGVAAMPMGCVRMVSKRVVARIALHVNAGMKDAYTDKAGIVWLGEKEYVKGGGFGFTGGQTIDRGADTKIEGTADPRLYQTEHFLMTAFTAEVPNGKYTVRLHFAETNPGISKKPGGRIFDVKIQGKTVLADFEVMKDAGAPFKALSKEIEGIEVANGVLVIEFAAKTQNPEINGIEILGE